jgi:hypothetical protein
MKGGAPDSTGASVAPDAGAASGASAPSTDVTTTQSEIITPAFAYVYNQVPDPNATDANDEEFMAFLQDIATLAKDAKSIASFVSGIIGGINAGITILQFLGILSKPPDEIALLTKDVNAIGTGLTWQTTQSYVDMNYGPETVAIDFVQEDGNNYVADNAPDNIESANGVGNLELDAAWTRSAIGNSNDSTTDQKLRLNVHPKAAPILGSTINWKNVVKPPAISSTNLVFDWRMGAPFLLKGIALRLIVMNAVDPNFKTDHHFDAELSMMRNALVNRYQQMLAGVQCGSTDYEYFSSYTDPHVTMACAIVCADVYTGISAITTLTPPQKPNSGSLFVPINYTSTWCAGSKNSTAFADAMNATEANVRMKMPLYEMQAMIDLLYTLLNPAPDLTQPSQHISPRSNPHLCIGTVGQSASWGTNLQLTTCNSNDPSQVWTYNRTTGQITNPFFGVCIDQRWGTSANTDIGVWGCDTPHADPDSPGGPASQIDNPAQKWTFDPTTGQLRNAFGNAMAWFVNPISPGPASDGTLIITEVVGQGGGLLVPPLDASSTSNNMIWMENTIYDPPAPGAAATQCYAGGVQMHCCPTGYAMIGALPNQDVFKCAPLGNATGSITLDTGTQRNGMHACPSGLVMVGLNVPSNLLACQALPAGSVSGEWVDTGTQDVYPMHTCQPATAASFMAGIRVDQNKLTCDGTSLVQ